MMDAKEEPMPAPQSLTTRRLIIVSIVSFLGSGVAYVFAQASVDLGFFRCGGRFELFEKPGCRAAALYVWTTELLLGVAAVATIIAVGRGWRAWRSRRRA
jgi:hypothetical protein